MRAFRIVFSLSLGFGNVHCGNKADRRLDSSGGSPGCVTNGFRVAEQAGSAAGNWEGSPVPRLLAVASLPGGAVQFSSLLSFSNKGRSPPSRVTHAAATHRRNTPPSEVSNDRNSRWWSSPVLCSYFFFKASE